MKEELAAQVLEDQQERCKLAAEAIKKICLEFQVDFEVIAISPTSRASVLARELLPDGWSITSNLVPKEKKR